MEAEPPKAAPPNRKRRRFQFRLRTLMLIAAIVAVQCAVCFPALKRWQKQREVEEALQELIATIELQNRSHPTWARVSISPDEVRRRLLAAG
jgi:Tfp pilus assembly protein FimT